MSQHPIDSICDPINVKIIAEAVMTLLKTSDGTLSDGAMHDLAADAESPSQLCVPFSFIGADPNTRFPEASRITLDARGFGYPSSEVGDERHSFETSRKVITIRRGVRLGVVKRTASAVGDSIKVVAASDPGLAALRKEIHMTRAITSA